MDEKVEVLIIALDNGLASLHIHLDLKQSSTHTAQTIARAYDILLEIIAVQKDFPACFRNFPHRAALLAQGAEIPTDEQHQVYEWLKECLLGTDNRHHGSEYALVLFRNGFPANRALLEPYLLLKQDIGESDVPLSAPTLERLAYGLLTLLKFAVDEGFLHPSVYRLKPLDNELILRYNQNRVMRIDEALMANGTKMDNAVASSAAQRIPCIRCGSYGPLLGYKESQQDKFYFVAYGFTCAHCGFDLFDQKDLMLAGLNSVFAFS